MIVHFQAHRQKIGACAPIVAKRVPLLAEFALASNCGAKDESLGELEQNPAFCTGSQLCVIDTPVECAAVFLCLPRAGDAAGAPSCLSLFVGCKSSRLGHELGRHPYGRSGDVW